MKLFLEQGATSVILNVFVADSSSTTGAGLTGLVFNTSGLTAYSRRPDGGNAGGTAITLATATRGTFTSGGFVEIDATNMPGWYEFHVPNAALASGARSVALHLKGATNMAPLPVEIELTVANLNAAIAADVLNATAASYNTASTIGNKINSAGSAADPLTNAASTYTTAGTVGNILWRALQMQRTGTAQAGASGTITLDASASATTDFYKGGVAFIASGTGALQPPQEITAYNGSTKVATVAGTWTVTPDSTSVFVVYPGITSQTFPANFAALAITGGGAVTAGTVSDKTGYTASTVSDKTGYSLASGTQTFNMTGNITGNVSGSVGSVTGAVGSVTGAVGSVTGAVASVTGAVGSVTGNVGGNVVGSIGSVAAGGLDPVLDAANAVETGLTIRGLWRLMGAVLAGKASGLDTATAVFRNAVADSKARVTATTDANGNRTAVTTDQT